MFCESVRNTLIAEFGLQPQRLIELLPPPLLQVTFPERWSNLKAQIKSSFPHVKAPKLLSFAPKQTGSVLSLTQAIDPPWQLQRNATHREANSKHLTAIYKMQ